MKNVTVVLNRMKKLDVEGIKDITTIEEGIDLLVNNIIMVGGRKAVELFKRYAVHCPEYVKEKHPSFYSLLSEVLESREDKQKVRLEKMNGLTEEEAKAELEKSKILNALGENRVLGYARVSTKDQNLARQLKALTEAGCQYIFQEKKTGKNLDRIEYKSMMNHVKSGDTIVISELTRMARSTSDLFKLLEELNEKGVMLKSLKETWLDTTTATGRLLFTFMAGISQFERELMLERQAEGIAVAKENGVTFGKKLNQNADIDLAISLYKEGKYTTTQIADMCNISRTTLWRRLKALNLLK